MIAIIKCSIRDEPLPKWIERAMINIITEVAQIENLIKGSTKGYEFDKNQTLEANAAVFAFKCDYSVDDYIGAFTKSRLGYK